MMTLADLPLALMAALATASNEFEERGFLSAHNLGEAVFAASLLCQLRGGEAHGIVLNEVLEALRKARVEAAEIQRWRPRLVPDEDPVSEITMTPEDEPAPTIPGPGAVKDE